MSLFDKLLGSNFVGVWSSPMKREEKGRRRKLHFRLLQEADALLKKNSKKVFFKIKQIRSLISIIISPLSTSTLFILGSHQCFPEVSEPGPDSTDFSRNVIHGEFFKVLWTLIFQLADTLNQILNYRAPRILLSPQSTGIFYSYYYIYAGAQFLHKCKQSKECLLKICTYVHCAFQFDVTLSV